MAEGTHAVKPSAKKKSKYPLVIAGTAVMLLTAGVLVQVLRPVSAFPDTPANATKGTTNQQQTPLSEQSVARVGKQLIKYDLLAQECVSRYGEEVLDNMISRTIIQQACDEKGVEVTAAEVNEEIVTISKKFGLAVDQWLQMLQAERNVTPAQYRRDIIWPMIALRKLAGEQVKITEKEMAMAFERNYGPRVKARAIVLDNPRRATEVWEKARANPEDFGRLAKEFSIDPNSRALEGAIPPIRQYGGSPEVEKVAFRLKPNELSGVIQVGVNQYVILFCEGRTEQVVKDRREVDDILRQELHEELVQKQAGEVFQKLKDEAFVQNYLTGVSSGGKKAGAGTTGSPIQQVGGTAPAGSANRVVPAGGSSKTTVPATVPRSTTPAPQSKAPPANAPKRPTSK